MSILDILTPATPFFGGPIIIPPAFEPIRLFYTVPHALALMYTVSHAIGLTYDRDRGD